MILYTDHMKIPEIIGNGNFQVNYILSFTNNLKITNWYTNISETLTVLKSLRGKDLDNKIVGAKHARPA